MDLAQARALSLEDPSQGTRRVPLPHAWLLLYSIDLYSNINL